MHLNNSREVMNLKKLFLAALMVFFISSPAFAAIYNEDDYYEEDYDDDDYYDDDEDFDDEDYEDEYYYDDDED